MDSYDKIHVFVSQQKNKKIKGNQGMFTNKDICTYMHTFRQGISDQFNLITLIEGLV